MWVLLVVLLSVVVVVHNARPRMVGRRVVVWRWQALGWVGMMLEKKHLSQQCGQAQSMVAQGGNVKVQCSREKKGMKIGAGNKKSSGGEELGVRGCGR